MSLTQIAFLAFIFLIVFGLSLAGLRAFGSNVVRDRLDAVVGNNVAGKDGSGEEWIARVVRLSSPLAKLSLPEEGWENSALRIHFMNAGLRDSAAPVIYFAAKTILAAGLPFVTFFIMAAMGTGYTVKGTLFFLLLTAAIGYYLPNVLLRNLVSRRKREIFESFPDALDLLTVCVEAGLGMDAALSRVANEMALRSPALAEELQLVNLELRAGNGKEKALRNLALRSGVQDVDALVAMLIQAERFGTSIAESLRVQSDMLRTKRRQRAEEQAAKIALKLLFPLIFFIFPSLLLVLLGPAFIQIYRVLLPTMAGGH
jgi:tight adherence protein C